MKRIVFACLALVLCLGSACGTEAPLETGPAVLELAPLIQTASARDGATRLLPAGNGVLALWEQSGALSGAYVSAGDSALTENMALGNASLDGAAFLETETGKGILAAGNSAWYLLLKGSGEERALPEGVSFTGVLYRNEGLVCRKGSLLLLLEADLGEPLVLTDTAVLPGYGEMIKCAPDGRLLWYVRRSDGGEIIGLGAFAPGETREARRIDLAFSEALAAPGNRVLLRRDGEGETVFLLLDLETEEAASLVVPFAAGEAALTAGGDQIALLDPAGRAVRVWDFAGGCEVAVKSIADLGEGAALCYGGDGVLYASLRREETEILVTLR